MERLHLDTQKQLVQRAGFSVSDGYCGPVAWAYALLGADAYEHHLVAEIQALVRKLRRLGIMEKGTTWGECNKLALALGIEGRFERCVLDQSKQGWAGDGTWHPRWQHRVGYPTMAQWARDHPNVVAAVVRGTCHVGYVERAVDDDNLLVVYNMGARKRIDHAFILEED